MANDILLNTGTGPTKAASLEISPNVHQQLVDIVDINRVSMIGDLTATPNANSVIGRLKALLTGTVLAAGTNIIGKVGIDQTTPGVTDSVTLKSLAFSSSFIAARPADTIAYSVGDVIGGVLTFNNIGVAGKQSFITDYVLTVDVNAVPTGMTTFRLYLYSSSPASAFADNIPFDLQAGDRAAFLGFIDITTIEDLGATLVSQGVQLNKGVLLTTANIYGYLVTTGAFTPTASSNFTVKLSATVI